jgi:hypothetical protein
MKMKLFQANGNKMAELEAAVNDWIGKLPDSAEVKHVNTALTAPSVGLTPAVLCVISVWWDERP